MVGAGQFTTCASMQDQRLDSHLHHASVQSYCGLPLTDVRGELYGAFCHLDFVPQELSDAEFAFLQKAVARLGGYIPARSELPCD